MWEKGILVHLVLPHNLILVSFTYIYIYIIFFLSLTVELMGESPGQAFRMSHSFAAVNMVCKYVHITCLKLEHWNLKKKYF